MSTYCISDIHGHFHTFAALLDDLSLTTDDAVYVLGDVIDRGPNIAELLLFCVGLSEEYDNFHFLVGNHEHMAYQYLMSGAQATDKVELDHWLDNVEGSSETIEALAMLDDDWIAEKLIPWFGRLSYVEQVEVAGQEWMLVHAGFNPKAYGGTSPAKEGVSMEVGLGFGTQTFFDMTWIREEWMFDSGDAPLPVVHGHTPTVAFRDDLAPLEAAVGESCYLSQGGILYYKNKIDIDCGASSREGLGALRLDDFEEFHRKIILPGEAR